MNLRRLRPNGSARLTVVFLGVLVPAAATLVWLGLRLLEQDRILWAQRDIERQDAAADSIIRSLNQIVASVERRLLEGAPVEQAVMLRRRGGVVDAEPRSQIAWLPLLPPLPEADGAAFASGEKLEFAGELASALDAYRAGVRSTDPAVRAAALLRSARVHRKRGAIDTAAADYRALMRINAMTVNGMPADLVARRALCDLLRRANRSAAFEAESALLERDFVAGRWLLDRDAWELVAAQLSEWRQRPIAASREQRALSAVAAWFARDSASPSGRRLLQMEGTPVTLFWQPRGLDAAAAAVPMGTITSWLATAASEYPAGALNLTLLDEARHSTGGASPPSAVRLTRRSAADTGLPWTLVLAPGGTWGNRTEVTSRRRLLTTGLAALGLLLAGGSYLLWRVVQRELAIAKLQAEFVSAVSHEFRTPVTSLRHTIELLQEDDELPRDRRQSFYAVLGRSTERLHRLVESLLDFARMEDGRKPYVFEPVNPAAFAETTAEEFERDAVSKGRSIDVVVAPDAPREIRADRDALGHAVWNLLDNAVKYSPDGGAVSLAVERHDRGVALAVRDRGVGIPRGERSEIFRKFVRGERAAALGIKGTGVGLAIVSHIIRAHGGVVEVDSEEGKGSTFRLVLPTV